jgi:hypothetical protein
MSQAAAFETRTDPTATVVREVESNGAEELNAKLLALGKTRLQEIAQQIVHDGFARAITIENDGVKQPIALTLRPRLLNLTCRGYVHHVTWHIRMGLRRLSRILRDDPRAREILPLSAIEDDWLQRYRRTDLRFGNKRGERIICRLDALARFDGSGWQKTLKFLEPNVVGIGGMRYSPNAEEVMLDRVVPALTDADDEMALEHNFDPRALLMDDLLEHARALGVSEKPTIAFVDDKSLYKHGGEFSHLVPYLNQLGHSCIYADPRELELSSEGHVVCEGRRVHVMYRFLEIRELADIEAAGHDLRAMHAAFAQGMVVPTAGGDLEHKSSFEVLTNPLFRAGFTSEQLAVFKAHVLWTRLLFERKTTGPDGTELDLVRHAREHKERLVLKPNRAYGGEGVVIGECAGESEWQGAIDAAMREPKSHVVQELSPPDIERFPQINAGGDVELVPLFAAVGFFPGRKGLGVFGRVSKNRVVNIHAGGGISPFLVNVT